MTIKKIMGVLAVSMAVAQEEKSQQTAEATPFIPYSRPNPWNNYKPGSVYSNMRNFPGSYARLTKYRNAKAKRRAGI